MNHTTTPTQARSYCPVCNTENIRWRPLPNIYINMWRHHGFKHIESCEMTPLYTYSCPECGASDRERLYALFLHEAKAALPIERIIHFAPEPALSKHICQEQYSASYRTADMSMSGVDFHVDLQSLPFANDSFDFFLCSHVLEHVADDRKAIRELYRITKPGGSGILMAPVCHGIETTLEAPSITDVGERWRLFGQDDHVRLYSHDDYVGRITESGFLLQQLTQDDFGKDVFHRLGLKPSSTLYVARKPSANSRASAFHPRKPTHAPMPSIANSPAMSQEMSPPKVSIILTSYNHGKFLHEAIQSALSQTYRNFELIIWDDASTDDSWPIIQQYKDSRIRAYRNDTRRYATYNVNKAITEIARGEYIAIHHSDDVWELEKLEKQVNFLDENPETGAVFTWTGVIDENSEINSSARPIFNRDNQTRHELLGHFFLSGNCLCHPSVLIRKQCYDDCGAYNLALWQLPDFDMWIRLCFQHEIHILPECLVKFRWKSDGSNTSAPGQQANIRTGFEYYMVLGNYCHIASREEFLKIFPFSEKYCNRPDADLEFALAMTAIEFGPSAQHRLFGQQLLYQLMSSPERAEKIRAVHHFDYMNYAEITKEKSIFASSQATSASAESKAPPDFSQCEQAWRNKRWLLKSDGILLADSTLTWKNTPTFHLFVRLDEGQFPLLADTLESLNQQSYQRWHIDIVSTQAPPPGLEQLPSLGWQRIGHWDEAKASIDFLAASGRRDWLLEIPAGAVLDSMCLWRIAAESQRQPGAPAFYVDDDWLDTFGERQHLRLKPGANSEWLRSLDLAGPLFMSRQAWRLTGGAAITRGSPWFDQLLRLQEQAELGPPMHIADALLSFAHGWTSSDEDCLAALEAQRQRLDRPEEDIIPLGNQAWRTLPRLKDYPPISIVVVSDGQLEFLTNLLESLLAKTTYPAVEFILMAPPGADPELDAWTDALSREADGPLQQQPRLPGETYLQSCHRGIEAATHELVLLLREDCHLLQESWLADLVRTLHKPGVAAVAPRLVQPTSGLIENIGQVAGFGGECPSPYRHAAHYTEHGYLGQIQVARDIASASSACLLIDRQAYRACGGFPLAAKHPVDAEMDFAQALRDQGKRTLYQPQVTVVHYGAHMRAADPAAPPTPARPDARVDPWWNPNLSLVSVTPVPEQEYLPPWQYLPVDLPRIVARPVPNAQGDYRVISPLKALRQAGKALDCLWTQYGTREFSAGELARLRPDSLIVQNYIHDPRLRGLAEWRAAGLDTFIVYALDDLLTEMPLKSSMRQGIQANARSRFRTALKYCDRLVVSTEFLAETYRPLIPDIRVIPNRLEGERWLKLQTNKRAGRKPRIGWAGGSTHRGDLELLTAIIEATRDEADWVFMGMHTDPIRPLLTEFHPGVGFEQYPRALAALDLDIAVAPLEQNRFNQGKSNLRLLEYGALGLPVVCTDIDPYRDSPACTLPNDPLRWIAALRERIHDADAREAEGEAMRRWVRQHFILEEHLDQWLAAHLPS